MGLYIGVDGVARKVKSIYVGVGGVARKVAKGYIGVNGIARQFYSSGLTLSALPEGALVAINENGRPALFYLVQHDYQSSRNGTGRTLLMRKDIYNKRTYDASECYYEKSDIDAWLNSSYNALLDAKVQELITAVTIPYTYYPSNGGSMRSGTLSRRIFLPSAAELNKKHFSYIDEGDAFPVADAVVKAYYNGSVSSYWLRTQQGNYLNYVYAMGRSAVAAIYEEYVASSIGSRPCFTLPADATVNPQPNADGSYTLTI